MTTGSEDSKQLEHVEALIAALRRQVRRVRHMADSVHRKLVESQTCDVEAGWRLAA